MIRNFPYSNKFSSILFLLGFLCLNSSLQAQRTMTLAGASGGSLSSALGTTTGYAVNESLFTDAEIGAGPSNSTLLSLRLQTNFGFPATPVGNNIFNNVRISVKEVPATTVSLAAAGSVYSLNGYTTIFSGTLTAPAGNLTDLTVPFSTPFPRTAGMNLMVLIERLDGISHGSASTLGNWRFVNHGTLGGNFARRYFSNTAPVLDVTAFTGAFTGRSVVGFSYDVADPTVNLDHVYTLGKLPIPYGTPHTVQANISNNSASKAYGVKAILKITGANTQNDTITIDSILPYSRRVVDFPAYTPTNYGVNTVNVTIEPPMGGFAVNTSYTMDQTVTSNIYSLAYGFNGNPPAASGGVGFNGATGDFVAKFYTDSPSKVNQVIVTINAAANGPQPFKVGIWGDSGTGTPGALLWESAQLSSSVGSFTVPVTPKVALPANTSFFVGVRQLGTVNIAFAYQVESPPRVGSFFYTSPTGATAWTDFSVTNSGFRFLAEARLELANDVGVAEITTPVNGNTLSVCSPIAPEAKVVNYGQFDQVDVPVTLTISEAGAPIYTETVVVPSLTSGQVLTVAFPNWTPATTLPGVVTNYTSTAGTSLLGDQDSSNDAVLPISFSTGQFASGYDVVAAGNAANATYNYANSTTCALGAPSQPTYNWIPNTGLTQAVIPPAANAADDIFLGPIQLPFTYYYFGATYDQFWISSNGFITFTDPAVFASLGIANDGTALNIPAAGGLDNYIAGAMTDLDLDQVKYTDAQVHYGVNPSNPAEFVITFWHAHKFYGIAPTTPEYITFQIILKNNKFYPFGIQFNDTETSTPIPTSITNLCTVGAESATGTNGILYRRFGSRGAMFGSPLAFEASLKDSTVVKVNSKVFLSSGDAVTSTMGAVMPSLVNFPITDPYSAAPLSAGFTHVNNGPTVSTTALVTGIGDIADWVFIELRQGQPGVTSVVYTQAALLKTNGDIVDAATGVGPVIFPKALPGKYYVTIRHRNHLSFRTTNLIDVTPNTPVLNFSDNTVPVYGATPLINITPTFFVMVGGDANYDGSIDAFDTIDWEIQNGLFDDYTNNSDYNMDGSVDAFDSITWEINNGKFAEID